METIWEKYDLDNAIYVNKTFIDRNKINIENKESVDFSKITALIPDKGFSKENINKIKKIYKKRLNFMMKLRKFLIKKGI